MHIKAGYYAFEQRFLDGALIKKISKESMVEFYRARVLPSSPSRAKCSTQIVSLHVPVPAQVLSGFHSGGADQDKKDGVVDDDKEEKEEVEEEEEKEKEIVQEELRFEPTPADLNFLHSKPDRASLLSYMETKKKEEEANVDHLDRLIKHLNLSLDQLDQQVLETNRAVNLLPPAQIYSDIVALKDALDVGVGAVPVQNWKAEPALIDLSSPPSPNPKL
jgi:hypothetical protein